MSMYGRDPWGGPLEINTADSATDDDRSRNLQDFDRAALSRPLDETQQSWLLGPGEQKKKKYVDLGCIIVSRKLFVWTVGSILAAGLVAGLIAIIVKTVPRHHHRHPPPDNYTVALHKALMFFNAQKSGKLPKHNNVSWRGNSCLNDGKSDSSSVIKDLVGGYYDAGDAIKFNFPASFAMTMLSWSVIEYSAKYEAAGELNHIKDIIKWGTDYFLKTFNSSADTIDRIAAQVGVGDTSGGTNPNDHYCWMRPEDIDYKRPVYECHGCSDLAAEMAAALAAASIVFKDNKAYSQKLVHGARTLFKFSRAQRGRYSASSTDAAKFYNSSSYWDEYIWGAAWLYYATGNSSYLQLATTPGLAKHAGAFWGGPYYGVLSWDNKLTGAQVLLSRLRLFLSPGYPYEEILHTFHNQTSIIMCSYLPSFRSFNRTKGGMIQLNHGNPQPLQYVVNAAFLATLYSDYLEAADTPGWYCGPNFYSRPTLVEALKDRHVKNISCGSNYSASICIHKWVSGVDQSVCFGCRQAFGFTRKRHNCYNCGLVHCHACSSKKALRAALAPTPGKPHRVCDSCYVKLKSAGNTTSRRITAPHHPLDVREMYNKRESKTSRLLLPPSAEPLKDIHIKLAQPGPKPDPHALVRAPQPPQAPSLLQFADIAFPSSLTALQYAFNYKPAMGITPQPQPQPQPLPQPHTQTVSNSRPSSPYSRRPSPPRSVSPAFSRGVIDSLKKTNDLLSQEVSRMQNQIKSLKQKTEGQDAEIQKLNGTAEEATFLAAQASSKSTVAKEVIKSVMAELEEMKEKLPAEMLNSEEFKAMNAQVEGFFSTGGAPVVESQSSLPADTVCDRQNQPEQSTLVENSTNRKYRRMSANLDGADMRSLFQNGEDTQKDGNTSSEIREAGTLESSKSGSVLPTAPKHEAKREVIEQFEPGVYVTLIIQNGTKTFKRVRFSKRRFAEQQAEEWWKENKDRLLKKYAVPIANSSSTESALTHRVPAEENNGVTPSS